MCNLENYTCDGQMDIYDYEKIIEDKKTMNILVACEESQEVCKAFREKGHNAFSCDIQECSGGHPEWHIQGDVLPLLDGHCQFKTEDGTPYNVGGEWDMILAFPPCTHLAVSGARHFAKKYEDGRQLQGVWFFCQFLKADCKKICIENPVNIISGEYVRQNFHYQAMKYGLPTKPTQSIQPYWFGDPFRKKTNLWLKGLEKLKPTNIVEPQLVEHTRKDGRKTTFSADYGFCNAGKSRSKTYPGVAKAMADAWG